MPDAQSPFRPEKGWVPSWKAFHGDVVVRDCADVAILSGFMGHRDQLQIAVSFGKSGALGEMGRLDARKQREETRRNTGIGECSSRAGQK